MENEAKTKQKIIETISRIIPNVEPDKIFSQLDCHLKLLLEENKKFNLTAIDDYFEALERHLLDSIIPIQICLVYFSKAQKIIEIGSGGGFPGIPVGILFPEKEVILVESIGKKAKFLKYVIEKLNLKNIDVQNDRAEVLAHKDLLREKFDIAYIRALGSLPMIIELSIPFLKIGGVCIVLKGKKGDEEILQCKRSLIELKSEIIEVVKYSLINYTSLQVIVIKKLAETPKIYPRQAGIMAKNPLNF